MPFQVIGPQGLPPRRGRVRLGRSSFGYLITSTTCFSSATFGSESDMARSPINVTSKSPATFSSVSSASQSIHHINVTCVSSATFGSSSSASQSTHLSSTTARSSASFASVSSASLSTRTVAVTSNSSATFGSSSSSVLSNHTVNVTSASSASFTSSSSAALSTRTVTLHCFAAASLGSAGAINKTVSVHSLSAASFGSSGVITRQITTHSAAAASFGSAVTHTRYVSTTCVSAASFGSANHSGVRAVTNNSSASFGSTNHVTVGTLTSSGAFTATSRNSVSVVLAGGATVPGGDANTGLQYLALSNQDWDHPYSFAETPDGRILCANGVGPMILCDPVAATATTAGVASPSTGLLLGGSGVGLITGERVAYQRFIDSRGNPSNLSPVSNAAVMGYDGLIDAIDVSTTGTVTVESTNHRITVPEVVVFQGVQGLTQLNGAWTVTPTDPDHFTVNGLAGAPLAYTQGGSWTWGVASVVYSSVPSPPDSKITRRQILRNLNGNLDVLYVDVDTTDLASTSFASTLDDETLGAGEPVPLTDGDGLPFADSYSVPPSHKPVIVAHHGRVFAAGSAPYDSGSLVVTLGLNVVQGIGTAWRSCFAGRVMAIGGCRQRLEILSVNESSQTATLSAPIASAQTPYATYEIIQGHVERNLIYYSEAGSPEAWPAWNTVALPDDGDSIVGMFTSGSNLYAIESRHVYRLVFSGVPATSGSIHLACRRGAINHRCVVPVEDHVFMLDESGIHSYDFEEHSKHISTPIQSVFHSDGDSADIQVDWSADRKLWHGSHDPTRETVRWFVNVVGSTRLDHAICYHYRTERWWVEAYPTEVTSSTTADIGYRRCVAGTEARRVIGLWQGTLDGVDNVGTLRGTVTSATSTTLTDSTAAFTPYLAGVPVSIVAGTGKGQQGLIVSSSATTLEVLGAWITTPDTTSVYQVGGVPWSWKSGWFQQSDDQSGNPRDVTMVYQPHSSPTTMDLSLYYDHSLTPRKLGYSQTNDGVTTTEGQPAITVDLSRQTSRPGFSTQRLEGHMDEHAYGDLHIALGLSGVQATEPLKLYHLVLSGAEQGGTPSA